MSYLKSVRLYFHNLARIVSCSLFPTSLSVLFLCLSSNIFAQDELSSELTDYIESIMEDENAKIDFEELEEQYLNFRHSPLSLNDANYESLSRIQGLTESDIFNLLDHRKRYGDFQTLFELKNIPGFNYEKIRTILPFVCIMEEQRKKNIKTEIKDGRHLLMGHYQQVLQKKKGYLPNEKGIVNYAGKPMKYYLKYQFRTPERINAGCMLEKDAGEKFWDKDNHGNDFQSIYFQLKNIPLRRKQKTPTASPKNSSSIGCFKSINLGDYKVSFGHGLVVGNSSIFGKSTNVIQPFAQREGLYKYTSLNESNFFRGAGTTLSFKDFDCSLFFSRRKKDASLGQDNSRITSFKTDGYHRTVLEISRKFNIRETVFGGNATFRKNRFQLGFTGIYYKYSSVLFPTDKVYNFFKLKNTNHHYNLGLNYKVVFRRMSFFGETAIDAQNGIATINGLSVQPNSRMAFFAIQRMYQPEYQANFSNAFGENSRTENESGFYIGAKLLPIKKLTLSIYADVFRFPWAKYTVQRPSQGQEYLAQIIFNTNSRVCMQMKYKYKDFIEQASTKQTLRYVCKEDFKAVQLQTLLEVNKAESNNTRTYGAVVAQDIFHQWRRPNLSLNLHYAYFWADAYNNRFYLYERDILNTFSMPMLYGKGHRLCLNFKWSCNKYLQLFLNYSTYIYSDGRESISSGNELIEGNISSTIKGLIKVSF